MKLLFVIAMTAITATFAATDPTSASNGTLQGTARDAGGKPLASATVEIRTAAGATARTVKSSENGDFVVSDLAPGRYTVSATMEGMADAPAVKVDVARDRTTRADVSFVAGDPIEEELSALKQRMAALEEELRTRRTAEAEAANNRVITADTAPNRAPGAARDENAAPRNDEPQQANPPAAAVPQRIPEALEANPTSPGVDNFTPFAFGDFTWLNGTSRNKTPVLDTKFFTPEIRFDTHFMEDFNQPRDHTMGGSTESFRSGEFQIEQISVGGDFHWQNVRGRVLYMAGLFASTTPRNDASAGVGQWDLRTAYRYVSEAYGGYHFDVNHGLNVDAGIFVSYIGLFSYYNFDNWAYQPSFVSSNTPWFFNGLRVQWFPTNKLKIEPWVINGWQSYARFNGRHGLGGQILYRPYEWLSMVFNNYGNGTDDLGIPGRSRIHTDDSIEVRYLNRPEEKGISKMAFSLTGDAGCEYGSGVTCHGGKGGPKQSFLGWMAYNRIWWGRNKYALTMGGGKMNNPGRYLTLIPPINGADAVSGTPYFTESPGDKAHMWDSNINFQYMPRDYITWWGEVGYRHSDVPYWTGRGGITPPGGNNGSPANFVCANGSTAGTNDLAAAYVACGGPGSVWFPDLRHSQTVVSVGVMVKF